MSSKIAVGVINVSIISPVTILAFLTFLYPPI